jgi:hypothetical protein
VNDPELAGVLADAGAELVDDRPEVEIAERLSDLRFEAPHAILSLGSNQPAGGGRLLRARRRVARSLGVRGMARVAAARIRRRGYDSVAVIPWDIEQPVQLPGRGVHRRRIAELLPERVLVVGRRGSVNATLLNAVADEAAVALGTPVRFGWPLARTGVLVIVADTSVLRIAVGPPRHRIHAQRQVLEQLLAATPPDIVRERLPWPMEHGRIGLGDWSVEPRLQGEIVSDDVPSGLEWECMEFLAALHLVAAPGPSRSLVDDAHRCASVCPSDADRKRLVALGHELEDTLADVPRGFGHGDFWTRNLVCRSGRLAGVIDWDGGGPGRLPLLDLIHYQVSAVREGGHLTLGDALVASQFSIARQGGDEVTRAYCRKVGIDPDPHLLEALVLAFWIDRNALELELRPDTITPVWVNDNIAGVLDHLRRDGRLQWVG